MQPVFTFCGSINVRERPWTSKRQPIDCKRCCTDRLNAHLNLRHDLAAPRTSKRARSRLMRCNKERLFDHPVGGSEQVRRDAEAECLGSLEIMTN